MQGKLGTGLSWMLMLICAGFIVYFFSANKEQIGVLARISPVQVLLIFALHLGYLALHGYRYLVVLEQCGDQRIPFWYWFRIYVLGRFLNLIVPQMGNLYRSVLLKKAFGFSYTNYASSFLSFAWISNSLNIFLALATTLVFSPELQIGGVSAGWFLLALSAALVAGPLILDWGLQTTTIRQRHLAWVHAKASDAVRGAVEALQNTRYLVWMGALGVAQFFYVCVIFYVCFLSLGVQTTAGDVVLFYVLLQFSVYLNLTPGNLGIQEVAFGLLGEAMGIGMAEGILVSVLLRATGYVAVFALALPMGGLEVLRQRERYRS